MIGICIPAHDEERYIGACLKSATTAARHPLLRAEPVQIVVVLDMCQDRTATLAAAWPVRCLAIRARNVGMARAAGARHLLEAGARWLAFTDADTRVSPRWLVEQLSLQADVVCGTVGYRAGQPGAGPRRAPRILPALSGSGRAPPRPRSQPGDRRAGILPGGRLSRARLQRRPGVGGPAAARRLPHRLERPPSGRHQRASALAGRRRFRHALRALQA